jgi:TRAP-type C4-dicarboxylate transport system permease small subunit
MVKSNVSQVINRLLEVVCALPLLLIVVVTFFDVFARYIFSSPIKGSVEIVEFCMAIVVFGALPLVTRKRLHVSVSLVEGFFSGLGRQIKIFICDQLSAAALAILTWRLYAVTMDELEYGSETLVLMMPFWPLYSAMTLLAGVTTLLVLVMGFAALIGYESQPEEAHS